MRVSTRNSAAFVACSLALLLSAVGRVDAAGSPAPPGSTYASLSALPDWSGWWGQGDGPFVGHPAPPFNKVKLAELAQRRDGEIGAGLYCRRASFTGASGSFVGNFEFLFTPGRVTITNEFGLIRRIYTDGRPLPAHPEPSHSGSSVGHWEGDTLVVETTGIAPDAQLARFGAIGKDARITERIRLRQKDVLEIELTTVAPDIFAAPDRRTYLTGRVPGKRAELEADFCGERDRSYDTATGKERFDMTPPADLPPPPAN